MIRRSNTLAGLLLLCCINCNAASLTVEALWIREGPPGIQVLAGYGIFTNNSDADVAIEHAESNQFANIEFHETTTVYGNARMRPLDALYIPAGESLTLSPGGIHLMLRRPAIPVRAGDSIEITFTTRDGESLTATARVERAGNETDTEHHHHH